MTKLNGQCECGSVAYEISSYADMDSCHCSTCRRLTSGPFFGLGCHEGINFTKSEALTWYDSSDWARRGFCGTCGANLVYNLKGSEFYSVSVGTITNLPKDMMLHKEYFIDQKPAFYALEGDRPRLTGEEVFASFEESNDDE